MTRFLIGSALALVLVGNGSADIKDKDRRPVPIPGKQKMPEFADISEWINSPALTAADLTGKVVVVHFLTFG
jgi:hypothetical protein